jgi:hypothetical protein
MNIYILHIRAYIFIYLTTSLVTCLHAYLLHWYSFIRSYVYQQCLNKRCYYERMLQRTVFINKIRIIQRTWRNTIGRRSTRVRMTCRAFPLWPERLSSSLLSFVRFSYQFSSVICLCAPLALKIYIFFKFCYIILAMIQQNRVRKLINLDNKKEITLFYAVGLELTNPKYIYISMYARTNRCYNLNVLIPLCLFLYT